MSIPVIEIEEPYPVTIRDPGQEFYKSISINSDAIGFFVSLDSGSKFQSNHEFQFYVKF